MNMADMDKIVHRFMVRPYETRGNGKGVIIKFPDFYLKIYDGSGEMTYSVQVWRYCAQLPLIVEEVRADELIEYIEGL